jgi:hypothetical protein
MSTFNGWTIVNLPAFPTAPKTIEWMAQDIVADATSPFTGQQQIYSWQAAWLEASVTYQPMTNAQAQAWIAFLMALQGTANIFQLGDPLMLGPQNPGASGGTVTGSGQTGYSLITSSSGLTPGDWVQLGLRLYRVTSVSGGTLGIWPQILESPVGGTTLTIANTLGLFRLKSSQRKWSVNDAKMYGITFEMREAI